MTQPQRPRTLPIGWEKSRIVAQIAAAFAQSLIIPIVLVWLGHLFAASLQRQELAAQYVGLAISILAERPGDQTENLRRWALETVKRYSPVPLPADVQKAALSDPLMWGGQPKGGVPLGAVPRGAFPAPPPVPSR